MPPPSYGAMIGSVNQGAQFTCFWAISVEIRLLFLLPLSVGPEAVWVESWRRDRDRMELGKVSEKNSVGNGGWKGKCMSPKDTKNPSYLNL